MLGGFPCHVMLRGGVYRRYSGVPAAHCAVPRPRGEQPTLWQPVHTARSSRMLPHHSLLPRKEVVPATLMSLFMCRHAHA